MTSGFFAANQKETKPTRSPTLMQKRMVTKLMAS
jgi:hypothetical protein